jgi:hypothetical protein
VSNYISAHQITVQFPLTLNLCLGGGGAEAVQFAEHEDDPSHPHNVESSLTAHFNSDQLIPSYPPCQFRQKLPNPRQPTLTPRILPSDALLPTQSHCGTRETCHRTTMTLIGSYELL